MLARAAAFAYQKPVIKRLIWRSWYQFLARRYRDGRWTFMNYGYRPPEGTPALTLAPEDEADRSSIQLYHLVANAVDLSGREVLEIGSGRGGGASYVARYLRPHRLVGADVSPRAVAFCRARHRVPALSFETADAERLSFEADSFDAVVNVESSHCYGNVPGFLAEVRRVLRPNGYFLYADFRPRSQLDAWRAELLASGMRLVEERDIMSGVLAAMDADDESKRDLIEANIDRPLINVFRQFAGLRGSIIFDEMRRGNVAYRAFVFQRDTGSDERDWRVRSCRGCGTGSLLA